MNTPSLDALLSYFHQDFYLDHGGMWETVDAFIRDEPANLDSTIVEIRDRLAATDSEDELRDYVRSAGCEYHLQPDDGDYRTWLTEIARRIAAAR